MKPSPKQLESPDYRLLDVLDHQDIVPFIRQYLKKKTSILFVYILINLLFFGLIVFLFIYRTNQTGLDLAFTHFSFGIALTFLLIPIHEFIHVLAYRIAGARETYYDANFRKFYFMAIADQFVANRKEFTLVAVSPFIVISVLLLGALFVVEIKWQFTITGLLLVHAGCCAGDFSLINYFAWHWEKIILTYDDKKEKKSYFYESLKDAEK